MKKHPLYVIEAQRPQGERLYWGKIGAFMLNYAKAQTFSYKEATDKIIALRPYWKGVWLKPTLHNPNL